MRSEREIFDSVLALATKDDGDRAVIRADLLPVREYLHIRATFDATAKLWQVAFPKGKGRKTALSRIAFPFGEGGPAVRLGRKRSP